MFYTNNKNVCSYKNQTSVVKSNKDFDVIHRKQYKACRQATRRPLRPQRLLGIGGLCGQRPPFLEQARQAQPALHASKEWSPTKNSPKHHKRPRGMLSDAFRRILWSVAVAIGKCVREKVYFNARFDDVMLIVKREMSSMLRGLFMSSVTLSWCSMVILTMFNYRDDGIDVFDTGESIWRILL